MSTSAAAPTATVLRATYLDTRYQTASGRASTGCWRK